LLTTAVLACYGMTRSLWLDEAWVANSVIQRTWSGMFDYPDWLQTSPPLFLAIERLTVWPLGLSNVALRLYPAAMAVAGVAVFLIAARRVLSPALAALACAALAFHPIVIEYSRTLKQYSGEIAASAALLLAAIAYLNDSKRGDPVRKRFEWLAATVAVALPLAYSSVFLIPGLVWAVYVTGRDRRAATRAALLAGIAGAILMVLYVLFIRPNYAPVLREFWAVDAAGRSGSVWIMVAVVVCAAVAVRAVWKMRRNADWRASLELVCALPCLLLAASAALGWYPASPRTRLFALPCFLLLVGMLAEEFLDRFPRGRPLRMITAAMWLIAVGIAPLTVWRQVRDHRNKPEEDMVAALDYVRRHTAPGDLLLVHASLKEDFKLYAGIVYANRDGWSGRPPLFGDTGWPCCVRGHLEGPHASSAEAVIADLEAKVPRDYRGRIWLLYSTRPTQWDYTGLDEGKLWRNYFWSRGCPPEEYVAPENIAVSPMNCTGSR
jgi:hypothetical protein